MAKEGKDSVKEVKKSGAKDTKSTVHNKATDEAGLSFNVNTTKKWLKKQFEVVGLDMPKFHAAHVGLTAVVESLLSSILSHVNSHLPKEKSSLYKITLPSLSYPLQLDSDFSKLFKDSIASFEVDTNYTEQFWMTKSDVTKYIESHIGDNIQLEAKAYNLLCYLLLKYSIQLTRTSHHLMSYAGKKTLEPKALRAAVLIHTPETIANTIIMKLDDATSNSSNDDDEEDDEDEDKTESKDSKKKESKSSKKEAKEVSSEAEDSESEDEASDDDSGSESEEEKPVAKNKKGDKSSKASEKEDKKVKVKKNKD